jgi:hypothetical protein
LISSEKDLALNVLGRFRVMPGLDLRARAPPFSEVRDIRFGRGGSTCRAPDGALENKAKLSRPCSAGGARIGLRARSAARPQAGAPVSSRTWESVTSLTGLEDGVSSLLERGEELIGAS